MKKIGALIRSYGLNDFLSPVLRQYDWINRIAVLNYRFKNVPETEDHTKEIADSLCQENIEVYKGEGLKQHEAFNRGFEILDDCDYIFISDADELISHIDQIRLLFGMKQSSEPVGCCKILDYAFDLNHIYPIREHKPPVIAKRGVRFYEVRCYMGGAKFFNDVYVHHLGFLYKDLSWKINWEDKEDKDGTQKIIFRSPIEFKMPQEIRDMLDE